MGLGRPVVLSNTDCTANKSTTQAPGEGRRLLPGLDHMNSPEGERKLLVAIGDSTFGQIVGRHFYGDTVPGEHSDPMPSQLAGQVSQHNPLLVELYTE